MSIAWSTWLSIAVFSLFILRWAESKRESAIARVEIDRLLEEESFHEQPARRSATVNTPSRGRYFCWLAGASLFASVRTFVATHSMVELAVSAGIGALAGELVHRQLAARRAKKCLRRAEFSLPLTMERVVMGVSSGLDIIPAIVEATRDHEDPISSLLREVVELSNNGLSVVDALEMIGRDSASASTRHAFIHLALAHKEGGELVRPLRELSDATQMAYQEVVEEDIARLPVKAVLPLVVIFTGLIICFITVPLVQVSSITGRVNQGGPK